MTEIPPRGSEAVALTERIHVHMSMHRRGAQGKEGLRRRRHCGQKEVILHRRFHATEGELSDQRARTCRTVILSHAYPAHPEHWDLFCTSQPLRSREVSRNLTKGFVAPSCPVAAPQPQWGNSFIEPPVGLRVLEEAAFTAVIAPAQAGSEGAFTAVVAPAQAGSEAASRTCR